MQEATDDKSRKERSKREVGMYDGDRRGRKGKTDMSGRVSSLWRHSDLVYDGGVPQGKQREDASQEQERADRRDRRRDQALEGGRDRTWTRLPRSRTVIGLFIRLTRSSTRADRAMQSRKFTLKTLRQQKTKGILEIHHYPWYGWTTVQKGIQARTSSHLHTLSFP